jgi:hypothetical protein
MRLGLEDAAGPQRQGYALYTGSSTRDVARRVSDHKSHMGNARSYHHRTILENGLKANFRVVASFPKSLPGIDCADCGWLPRLYETVLMMISDPYLPPYQVSESSALFGVGEEEWSRALEKCGTPRSGFRPLNKAFPTKPPINDPSVRECRNCKTKQSLWWYYDVFDQGVEPTSEPVKIIVLQYLC